MAGERWNVASSAIADAVAAREKDARFGIALYPSVGEEEACKGGRVIVMPTFGSAAEIRKTVEDPRAIVRTDFGYTPTRATLDMALETLSASKAAGSTAPAYVLLVTDGRPNCPAVGQKYDSDHAATYVSIDKLAAAGIKTFVIGYLTDDYKTIMDTMAMHGGTTKHYPVSNSAELLAAIDGITSTVAPCSFALDTAVPGGEYVRVIVDGKDVPLSDSGFALDGPKAVRLNGSMCASVRDGASHSVKITVECEPVRPR
jgi:hypothetical protein